MIGMSARLHKRMGHSKVIVPSVSCMRHGCAADNRCSIPHAHCCDLWRLFANLRESNSITSSGEFVGSTDALPFQSRSRNVAMSHHPLARCTKATCGGSSTSTWSISTGHDHTRASTSTFRNRGIQQPPRFVLGLMSSPSQFWAVFTTSIARSFDAVRVGRKAADGVRRHDSQQPTICHPCYFQRFMARNLQRYLAS